MLIQYETSLYYNTFHIWQSHLTWWNYFTKRLRPRSYILDLYDLSSLWLSIFKFLIIWDYCRLTWSRYVSMCYLYMCRNLIDFVDNCLFQMITQIPWYLINRFNNDTRMPGIVDEYMKVVLSLMVCICCARWIWWLCICNPFYRVQKTRALCISFFDVLNLKSSMFCQIDVIL